MKRTVDGRSWGELFCARKRIAWKRVQAGGAQRKNAAEWALERQCEREKQAVGRERVGSGATARQQKEEKSMPT
eukprot:6190452-Pleurochrysis_carterae.AAC.3